MHDFFKLEGKSVCVVGGGQGIGEATCLAFARAGANVIIIDRDRERAQAVADQIEALGGRCAIAIGDVLEEAAAIRLMEEAEEAFGGISVLTTIVGMGTFQPLLETTLDMWEAQHQVNLRYILPIARAFAGSRIAASQPGAITFISSVAGFISSPPYAAYGAFKAALIHLARTMAAEWGPHGIRVNTVAPGSIITPRLPDGEEWRTAMEKSMMPIKRRGTVKEVADAILFLSSDMASFVTGQTLAVDGGLTATLGFVVPAAAS